MIRIKWKVIEKKRTQAIKTLLYSKEWKQNKKNLHMAYKTQGNFKRYF